MEYRPLTQAPVEAYGEHYYKSRGMRWLYDRPYDRVDFDRFIRKLSSVMPVTPETRILDLGCGFAQRAYFLAELSKHVLAVDLSQPAIDFARKNYGHARLRLVKGDALRPPTRGRYELILLVSIYEHLLRHEQDRLLATVKPLLAPGGKIAVHVAIAESWLGRRKCTKNRTGTLDFTGDPTHVCKFKVEDVEQHFAEHGYVPAGEYRRLGSYFLAGRRLEKLFSWMGLRRSYINEFVVEWLGFFSLRR